MRVSGRTIVFTVLAAALAVTALFVGLTLTHMEEIRASVAVRRADRPVRPSPLGELVVIPAPRPFYISRRPVEPRAECAAAGLRPATAEELKLAARGATAKADVSLYGVEGLIRGPGQRCAAD
jgi:hypothetical protein